MGVRGCNVAVTGGARGIGAEVARKFAEAGARVAIGDIDTDLAERAAAGIGAAVAGLSLDVSDRAGFAEFLDRAEAACGPLDVLVNNAGIMPIGQFADEPDALTDRVLDVNLRGVLTGSKLAAQRFTARGQGHIVNVASVMGTVAAPNAATYCATKFAVHGFSDALRQELRDSGVRVTTILPGFVRTELIAGMRAGFLAERLGMVDPDDVAAAVVRAVADGRGGEVFVPGTAGLIARGTMPLPAGLRALLFRIAGTERVTSSLDTAARAQYQRRVTGSAQ